MSFITENGTSLYVCSDGICWGKPNCHTTISGAVGVAESGSAILVANDVTYSGNFTVSGKSLTIKGGWDTSFGSQSGTTVLKGAPTAPSGSLTMQQVRITP